MKYKKINEVIYQINNIQGNPEEKVIKKLVKFAEKLKPYQEEYSAKVQELRLDNAATDKDGVLILTEKGDYKFNKEDYDTGIIRSAFGGRDDRGVDEKKPYCYVPTKLLIKINT
jgi:hypothetical protein